MPITDLDSYLPTMAEFLDHWSRVNVALNRRGDGDAILRDGCTLHAFAAERASLAAHLREASDAESEAARLRDERDYLAEGLRGRLIQLRQVLGDTVPVIQRAGFLASDSLMNPLDQRYLDELDRALELKRQFERDCQVALPSGFGATQFSAEVYQFRQRCHELKRAERLALALTERRRCACERVMTWLQCYRVLVRFELRLDAALLHALPSRTPASNQPPPP